LFTNDRKFHGNKAHNMNNGNEATPLDAPTGASALNNTPNTNP
jgi:hypothetical protein